MCCAWSAPPQAQVHGLNMPKPCGVWRKCHEHGVSLCSGFVQLVVQEMGFGHCSRLELPAVWGVGFTALLLFWVGACVHTVNLHQMEVSLFHLHWALMQSALAAWWRNACGSHQAVETGSMWSCAIAQLREHHTGSSALNQAAKGIVKTCGGGKGRTKRCLLTAWMVSFWNFQHCCVSMLLIWRFMTAVASALACFLSK